MINGWILNVSDGLGKSPTFLCLSYTPPQDAVESPDGTSTTPFLMKIMTDPLPLNSNQDSIALRQLGSMS